MQARINRGEHTVDASGPCMSLQTMVPSIIAMPQANGVLRYPLVFEIDTILKRKPVRNVSCEHDTLRYPLLSTNIRIAVGPPLLKILPLLPLLVDVRYSP